MMITRVAEVDGAALAVGHAAVVEDLQEDTVWLTRETLDGSVSACPADTGEEAAESPPRELAVTLWQ